MTRKIRRKNYRLDVAKLHRARRVLGTRPETETIHRALDMVLYEVEMAKALRTFVIKGKGHIEALDGRRR